MMRIFLPKPKAAQQTSVAPTALTSTYLGQCADVGSILHLQHTIGNQAVQRLLRTAPPLFGPHPGRIPKPTHVVQQSKGSRVVQRQPKKDEPKKGRVVRVERPRKARPVPPGPGAYTEEELRNWYTSHPDAKMKYVDKVNGKRTQDDAYTPDTLWVRGYTYALTNVFGDSGTEVWLNDDGKGKVIGIEREIP